jgi:hypothetical protein
VNRVFDVPLVAKGSRSLVPRNITVVGAGNGAIEPTDGLARSPTRTLHLCDVYKRSRQGGGKGKCYAVTGLRCRAISAEPAR